MNTASKNGQMALFANPSTTKRVRKPRLTVAPVFVPADAPVVEDAPVFIPVDAPVPEVSVVVPRKRAPRARVEREPVDVANLGVVDQVREALKEKNRLAAIMGFMFGGIIPFATFMVAHFEVDHTGSVGSYFTQLMFYMVLGGLIVSAKTVYKWSKLAFNDGWKAFGFVVLAEGVMTMSHIQWLCITILAYLIVINGLASACNLALGRKVAR